MTLAAISDNAASPPRPSPSTPLWMELDISRDAAAGVRVRARGGAQRQTPFQQLPPALASALPAFAAAVQKAARNATSIGASLSAAHDLHRALLSGDVADLRARLLEAAGGEPVLVRLSIDDPDLHAVPWEALCEPGSALGFWASSPSLLPVRGVTTTAPWHPREVRGAVQVLAVAPSDAATLPRIEGALRERVASGEVAWLDPVVGPAATLSFLRERLSRDTPHVLHLLGHGAVRDGNPAIRLADVDGEEQWLPVELLAQELAPSFRAGLRLVVLEACEGAQPGAFASAADILARAGADAVIAHLWPVAFDVARCCSEQLYRSLAAGGPSRGDVARSLNDARRAILATFAGSAEAFSPVLTLRAPSAALFHFDVPAPPPPPAPRRRTTALVVGGAALASLLFWMTRDLQPRPSLEGRHDRPGGATVAPPEAPSRLAPPESTAPAAPSLIAQPESTAPAAPSLIAPPKSTAPIKPITAVSNATTTASIATPTASTKQRHDSPVDPSATAAEPQFATQGGAECHGTLCTLSTAGRPIDPTQRRVCLHAGTPPPELQNRTPMCTLNSASSTSCTRSDVVAAVPLPSPVTWSLCR